MNDLPCLLCGATDSTVTVDVADGDTLRCSGCKDEFTVADVEKAIEAWGRVLPWLRSHPARVPAAEAVAS